MSEKSDRHQNVQTAIDAVLADRERFVNAVVADGWSTEMASEGYRLHRKTWDVPRAIDSITRDGEAKKSVLHIWPALPGAGVTPWIYASLCGVGVQYVRGGRRAEHFARFFCETVAPFVDTSFVEREIDWSPLAEHVVVSASDETVEAIREVLREQTVTAYGHRISMALVREGVTDVEISSVAKDIVMWRQQGCFSVRAIGYIGEDVRSFCDKLSLALAKQVDALSPRFSDGERAHQVQQFAVSQFTRPVFGTDSAWVELHEESIVDDPIASCVVSVHLVAPDEIESRVSIPVRHRQAIAVTAEFDRESLVDLGFTRVCAVGEMQAPPIDWPHDGRSERGRLFR